MNRKQQEEKPIRYENLRDFVSQMQAMGEVRVIEGADPHLEIGAIFEIFAGRKDRPLLLYDKIKGFPQKKQVPISMKRE